MIHHDALTTALLGFIAVQIFWLNWQIGQIKDKLK